MTTLLPRDDDNALIPVLQLAPGGASQLTPGLASNRTAAAFSPGARVVMLFATQPVFLAFGDETVTAGANDHYFPAGVYFGFSLGGGKGRRASHLAALRAGGEDGTLFISEAI